LLPSLLRASGAVQHARLASTLFNTILR